MKPDGHEERILAHQARLHAGLSRLAKPLPVLTPEQERKRDAKRLRMWRWKRRNKEIAS